MKIHIWINDKSDCGDVEAAKLQQDLKVDAFLSAVKCLVTVSHRKKRLPPKNNLVIKWTLSEKTLTRFTFIH